MNQNNIKILVDKLFEQGISKTDKEISQDIINEFKDIPTESLNQEELNDYYYFLASSYFQVENFNESNKAWEIGVKTFPESSKMNYGFGQALINLGNLELAIEYFNKVKPAELYGIYSLQMATYMYLWNKPTEGIKYLQYLFDAYLSLYSLDDTFLHIRHLPFFGFTWNTFVALLWLDKRSNEAPLYLSKYYHLADYDFSYLKSINSAVCNKGNNWDESIKLGATDPIRSPLFLAKSVNTYEEAKDIIEKAPNSIKTNTELLKCISIAELANKFGKQEDETKYINSIFELNKLLLEPYNVVNYNFLSYMEKLKEIYRERTKENNRVNS